jgi:hypothetical protein
MTPPITIIASGDGDVMTITMAAIASMGHRDHLAMIMSGGGNTTVYTQRPGRSARLAPLASI